MKLYFNERNRKFLNGSMENELRHNNQMSEEKENSFQNFLSVPHEFCSWVFGNVFDFHINRNSVYLCVFVHMEIKGLPVSKIYFICYFFLLFSSENILYILSTRYYWILFSIQIPVFLYYPFSSIFIHF